MKTSLLKFGPDSKSSGYSSFLQELEQKIAAADAVSFDYFDTLFVRTLLEPEDVFDILGRRFQIESFRQLRRTAQAAAFKRMMIAGRREITLEGIYACLDPVPVKPQELMRAEYQLELALVIPNPELTSLFRDVCSSGMQVVITSDMYLPADFFRESLRRHGFPDVPLFISSDRNATKRDDGMLFDIVATELGLSPDRILHIGDNRQSDVDQAKARGMAVFHFTEDRIPPKPKHYSPDASVARGLVRKHRKELIENSFQELGFLYGGPAALGFLDWVIDRARDDQIDHILFLARDGYVLHRVAESWSSRIMPAINYFMGSRTLFTLASMTESNFIQYLPFLVSGSEGLSPSELLERINVCPPAPRVMNDLGFSENFIVAPQGHDPLCKFLYAYRWEILKVCRRNRRGLLTSLKKIGVQSGDRVAFVDVGWRGTTQDAFEMALRNILEIEIFGYYFGLVASSGSKSKKAALFSASSTSGDTVQALYENRVAVELFFSAPHPSVIGLTIGRNGAAEAVTDPGRGEIENLSEISANIAAGMVSFAHSFDKHRSAAKFSTSPINLAMPLVEFAISKDWVKHPLLSSIKNFDAWSSTRNRSIGLADY